jgi:hypothetical protein
MQLIKKHKWCKIWELDKRHELIWGGAETNNNKVWRIEKTDHNDFLVATWGFTTKRAAMEFWNGRITNDLQAM